MKFSIAFSLLVATSHAFVSPQYNTIRSSSSSIVKSTLSTDAPTFTADGEDANPQGGLSMGLEELAQVLGGKGRAQIVWDCYSIGIEPAHFHGPAIDLGYDDYESIYAMLPSQRRSQKLGSDALAKLSELYATKGGKVEGGVASLSYISRAADSTTKLLLRMTDGLEVETVIIPWNGERSTLCISSQVGCKQGALFGPG